MYVLCIEITVIWGEFDDNHAFWKYSQPQAAKSVVHHPGEESQRICLQVDS
jgi:hypothetical protein